MTLLQRVSLLGALMLCACLCSVSLASGATLRAAGSVTCPHFAAPVTDAATSITSTTAVLNGHYAYGGGGVTDSSYEYGLTAGYGTTVTTGHTRPGGNIPDPIAISGLSSSTTYHFRYRIGLTSTGCDLTFTTLAAPSTAAPPLSPGSESADLILTASVGSDTVALGSNVTISLTVRHGGGATALNAFTSTEIPAGLSLVSASTSYGTCSGAGCTFGTLASGAVLTITIVAKANVVGFVSVDSGVGATNPDPNTSNNRVHTSFTVKAPLSTRTLTVNDVERIEGPGFGSQASKIRLTATIASDEARCTGQVTLNVLQSTTVGGANDSAATPVSVISDASGKVDGTFAERPGPFYRLSIPPAEQNAYRCSEATASFTFGPRAVKRAITATAKRLDGDPTRIRIAGIVTADSLSCVVKAPVSAARAGVKPTAADTKGAFSIVVSPGTHPSVLLSTPAALAGANQCAAAALKVDVPPQPVTRTITPAANVRPAASVGAAKAAKGWALSATVRSTQASCVKGATMALQHRDGPTDAWSSPTVSKPAGADRKLSLRVPFDTGDFRVALGRVIVGRFACLGDDAFVRAPKLDVKRSITAKVKRAAGAPRTIQISG